VNRVIIVEKMKWDKYGEMEQGSEDEVVEEK